MRDIRPPSWLELESVIPLEAEPGVTSVETVTTLSAETHAARVSRIYHSAVAAAQGMKLKHALRIAGTADIEANPAPANTNAPRSPPNPKPAPRGAGLSSTAN